MTLYPVYKNVYETLEELFSTVKQYTTDIKLKDLEKSPSFKIEEKSDPRELLEIIKISTNYIPIPKNLNINLLSIIDFDSLKEKRFQSLFYYNILPIYNPKGEVLFVNRGKGIGIYKDLSAYHVYKVLLNSTTDEYELIPISCVLEDRVIPLRFNLEYINKKLEEDFAVKKCSYKDYSDCIRGFKEYYKDIRIKDIDQWLAQQGNPIKIQNFYYYTPLLEVYVSTTLKFSIIPNYYKKIYLQEYRGRADSLVNQFVLTEDKVSKSFSDSSNNSYEVIVLYDNDKPLEECKYNASGFRHLYSNTVIRNNEYIFQRDFPLPNLDNSLSELIYQKNLYHSYKNKNNSLTSKDVKQSFYSVEAPSEYIASSIHPYEIEINNVENFNLQGFKVLPYGIPSELDKKGFYPKDFGDYKKFDVKVKKDKESKNTLSLYKELSYFLHIVKKTKNKYPSDGAMISLIPAVYKRSGELLKNPCFLIHFYELSTETNSNLEGVGDDASKQKFELFYLHKRISLINNYISCNNTNNLTRGQVARQNMLDIILEHNWVYRYEDESPFLLRGFIKYQKEDILMPIKACSYFFNYLDYLPRFKYENYFLGGKKKYIKSA